MSARAKTIGLGEGLLGGISGSGGLVYRGVGGVPPPKVSRCLEPKQPPDDFDAGASCGFGQMWFE